MSNEQLLSALKRYFGYNSFRSSQQEIIECALAGKDTLVLMPTGGGKSLCYQLPAMLMDGLTVVVSPLISLMKDQVDALRAAGLPAAALNSSLTESETANVIHDCLHGHIKLLYMSPENVLARTASLLQNVRISLFAIDEAHCISQWGHDFRTEYTQLEQLRTDFSDVPVMALTATADKVTRMDIIKHLKLEKAKVFISSFDRPNLSLSVVQGMDQKSKNAMVKAFVRDHKNQSGIIYCMSRKTVESVTNMLKESGLSVMAYHAGLSPRVRDSVQEAFIRDDVQIICATIAFGMGIDKSNIRWVIHYNLPKSIENFYQEIGRAGRDGLPADTLLFYSYADVAGLLSFANESAQKDINVERLKRMQEYAESTVCRRRILLNYFGEPSSHECHNCDVCHNPPVTFDGTVICQKALSAIARTQQQVGFKVLTDILMGNASYVVSQCHYDRLKTFGVGRDLTAREWNTYCLQMLHLGLVEIAYNEFNHLKITELGRQVLFDGTRIQLSVIKEPVARTPRKKSAKSPIIALLDRKTESLKEDSQLFEELRLLRRQFADRLGFPPYVVFSDRSLHEMARIKPLSLEAFADVSGVGEFKCRKYGEDFVRAIRRYLHKC